MKWLNKESYGVPALLAVGLHLVILGGCFVAVDFSDKDAPAPKRTPVVQATVVDISQTIIGKREEQAKKLIQQQAIEKKNKEKEAQQKAKNLERRKALEAQKKELAQAKKAKDKAIRQAAAAKKAAADKKKAADDAKKKAQQEALVAKQNAEKQKRLEQDKAEEEKKRKAEAAKQLAEKEKQRQLAADREAEKERLAKEAADAAAAKKAEDEKRAADEAQAVQSISSLINDRITAAWNRPASARNGMKTELQISFLPSGEVLAVNLIKSSGDALFDQRAVNAARSIRVEELSKIDPYVFDRNFRKVVIIFNPQDLRN
ncbi:cell envelope integrity protein TolA [Marinomonas sp. TI.3.20]|uniref:cell envelope integrity protein TolA n=1 Tax=Marinomonas sp. TI.3.20 TaxID=3121296 RepID=UPI00311E0934